MPDLLRSLVVLAAMSNVALADAPAPTEPAPPPTAAAEPALRMSVEVDPADYAVYHGWGVFIGVHPAATKQWRFRIGGGAATLPKAAVETTDHNKGWSERLEPVITLVAHRYFGHGRGGWFAGGILGASSITFTAPTGSSVDVRNVFAGIDLGYRWYPSRKLGLTITPHLGAIIPVYKSREPAVDTMTYDLLPVIPLPQILIGYEFDVL